MEALVITKCYSNVSFSYWLNSLVYPASKHFEEGLECLEGVKSFAELANDPEFRQLMGKVEEFKKISAKIMDAVKVYS